MGNKKQHIIPAAYLRAWSYPAAPPGSLGSVWVIQKSNMSERGLRSPEGCFCSEDRYTLPSNGGRNLAVENALAAVEGEFGRAQKRLRANSALRPKDIVYLSFFSAAMMSRTGHYPERIGTLLRTVQRQAARLAAKEGSEPSLSNAIEEGLRSLNAETARTGIIEFAKLLIQMRLSVFVTDDEAGFITGDEPCVVCVPGGRHLFLGHQDVEFTLPLSPRHLAFYSWKVPPTMYSNLDRVKVDEVNSRTMAGCRKEFVSWKGIVRNEWIAAH